MECGADGGGRGAVVDHDVSLAEVDLDAFDAVDVGQCHTDELFLGRAVHVGNVEPADRHRCFSAEW